MVSMKRFLAALAVLGAATAAPALAADANVFPEKPVNFVVTFPPGGGTDLLARLIGAELQKHWKQSVVVENRAGASGNIGAQHVARSPADGYTLLVVNSSFAVNPGVFRKLPFDPKADFVPVINVAFVPSVVVVPADAPFGSLKDLLAAAKGGQQIAFGSCGNGTPQHLAGEMLAAQSGAKLQHVPYRGCGPALTDVLGKQVGSAIVTASSAMQHIQAGKLRALGVTSRARSPFLPSLPTVAEQGQPGQQHMLEKTRKRQRLPQPVRDQAGHACGHAGPQQHGREMAGNASGQQHARDARACGVSVNVIVSVIANGPRAVAAMQPLESWPFAFRTRP